MSRKIILYFGYVTEEQEYASFSRLLDHHNTECIVISDIWAWKDNQRQLKVMMREGCVMMIICEPYSGDHAKPKIKELLALAPDVPVLSLSGLGGYQTESSLGNEEFPQDDLCSDSFWKTLNECLSKEVAGTDWIQARTSSERGLVSGNLVESYRAKEEDQLSAVDDNHALVAQSLRLKILPSSLIASEYEGQLVGNAIDVYSLSRLEYMKEQERLDSISESEWFLLEEQMSRSMGYQGNVKVAASCGKNVNGYAYDYETNQSVITDRFGEHFTAAQRLVTELEFVDDECDLEYRVISGLIFYNLDGWKAPILHLTNLGRPIDPEVASKARASILRERKFLIRLLDLDD